MTLLRSTQGGVQRGWIICKRSWLAFVRIQDVVGVKSCHPVTRGSLATRPGLKEGGLRPKRYNLWQEK
jgi:hypothetical protein